MILYQGKLYDSGEQTALLETLEQDINHTRSTKTLEIETVVNALDRLGEQISNGVFDAEISMLGIENAEYFVAVLIDMLKRESLLYKVSTELGEDFFKVTRTNPPLSQQKIFTMPMPLGTLLHIAAGNAEGLPAFSIAEGLLTGNVNILKLPQADNGLSLKIILQLIKIEPTLCDFIFVFDTPSTDLSAIQKMAQIADGIVTWGGDGAIAAVRRFAPLGTKLIEWGHKLSFAYISGYQHKEQELKALAEHILMTKQLLCSSCQTIFLDTNSMEDVYLFCEEFLEYLERTAPKYPNTAIGTRAEITLRKYSDTLEEAMGSNENKTEKTFQGEHCSLIACRDETLELSYMFGNCLVKRLPADRLFDALRKQKGYLQTAGLICEEKKRQDLTNLLARSGVVRIMSAGNMSSTFCAEAHDGEYALRRYTRIVNLD